MGQVPNRFQTAGTGQGQVRGWSGTTRLSRKYSSKTDTKGAPKMPQTGEKGPGQVPDRWDRHQTGPRQVGQVQDRSGTGLEQLIYPGNIHRKLTPKGPQKRSQTGEKGPGQAPDRWDRHQTGPRQVGQVHGRPWTGLEQLIYPGNIHRKLTPKGPQKRSQTGGTGPRQATDRWDRSKTGLRQVRQVKLGPIW